MEHGFHPGNAGSNPAGVTTLLKSSNRGQVAPDQPPVFAPIPNRVGAERFGEQTAKQLAPAPGVGAQKIG